MSYPDDISLERPEADAAEQAASVLPDDDDAPDTRPVLDDEVPEWDAREQRQVVHVDDEYR